METFIINGQPGSYRLVHRTHDMGGTSYCRVARLTDAEAYSLIVCGYISQNHGDPVPEPEHKIDPHDLLATEMHRLSASCEYERLMVSLPANSEFGRSPTKLVDPWYDMNMSSLREHKWIQPFRVSNEKPPEAWPDNPTEAVGAW